MNLSNHLQSQSMILFCNRFYFYTLASQAEFESLFQIPIHFKE